MNITLYDYQKAAVDKLKNGSILHGGVGSGKSITALYYYFVKVCKGNIKTNETGEFIFMKNPLNLYIITTAKKRDSLEWDKECSLFLLSRKDNGSNVKLVIDSWNNIKKYENVKNSFFIFDEQRLVGYGTWVKTFLKISRSNRWILLSATPGDTWMDYIPVFIANGFYKNKTEFLRKHVIFSRFAKYPKVERYIYTNQLEYFRKSILVDMDYKPKAERHNKIIFTDYNKKEYDKVIKQRWNPFENKPIRNVSETCYLMRKVVNSDASRITAIKDIMKKHDRLIIFYNFDYELELLRKLKSIITVREWNGHKHEEIPKNNKWVYLVQYTAGSEGWGCTETNAVIFFSQNYSYKIMEQASGRIDRSNTLYLDLYYYHILSKSSIDYAIKKCLDNKKNFNETNFIK